MCVKRTKHGLVIESRSVGAPGQLHTSDNKSEHAVCFSDGVVNMGAESEFGVEKDAKVTGHGAALQGGTVQSVRGRYGRFSQGKCYHVTF